ncbi:hypothetical protein CISIN_1g0453231mg, partial [Citrus sinensis]
LGWWSEGCLEQEGYALLKLKHDFFNNHCCQWACVECNTTTGKVISLDLDGTRKLGDGEGYLNASLFTSFQQLELLDL